MASIEVRRRARSVAAGGILYLREYAVRDLPFSLLVQPLVFGFILTTVARASRADPTGVLTLAIGAGAFSVWTVCLGAAAGSFWNERRLGRLAAFAVSPASLWAIVTGFIFTAMVVACVALIASVVLVPLAAGVPAATIFQFRVLIGLAAVLVSVASVALVLSPLLGSSEAAVMWINGVIYPVAILGTFFSIDGSLPRAIRPLAMVMPPYWAMELARDALRPGADLTTPMMTLAVSAAAWVAVAVALMAFVDRRIRRTGSVPLV